MFFSWTAPKSNERRTADCHASLDRMGCHAMSWFEESTRGQISYETSWQSQPTCPSHLYTIELVKHANIWQIVYYNLQLTPTKDAIPPRHNGAMFNVRSAKTETWPYTNIAATRRESFEILVITWQGNIEDSKKGELKRSSKFAKWRSCGEAHSPNSASCNMTNSPNLPNPSADKADHGHVTSWTAVARHENQNVHASKVNGDYIWITSLASKHDGRLIVAISHRQMPKSTSSERVRSFWLRSNAGDITFLCVLLLKSRGHVKNVYLVDIAECFLSSPQNARGVPHR